MDEKKGSKTLIVGSRESKLAVVQSRLVMDCIQKSWTDLDIELVTMKTTGDIILDRTLDKVGGKGLFVKELDKALMEDRIHISVHSLKDMPAELPAGVHICAYSKREDPRDVLILPKGGTDLDLSKPIGCASQRRKLQLQKLFPGCIVKPVRGNVLTRLEKLDRGDYGALVLAGAGLRRLGLEDRISRVFDPAEMIPAAGQGIMAVESKTGQWEEYTKVVDHPESRTAALAERAFTKALDGGCSSPIAAYARVDTESGTLQLSGLFSLEGREDYVTGTETGSAAEPEAIGIRLAQRLKAKF